MSTIVFAGDSVTQGCFVMSGGSCVTGLTNAQKFSTIISNARGFANVVNAGKSGDTVAGLSARLSADVLSHNPNAVCIMIGINDVDTTTPTAVPTFESTLAFIVGAILTAGASVTILMPNLVRNSGVGQAMPAYLDAMSQVAHDEGIAIVPVYDLFCRKWLSVSNQSELDDLFYDYKHPSAAGHQFIADCVLQPHYADACV